MVDIETTGTDQKTCEILQLGFLELNPTTIIGRKVYWKPGKSLEITQHSDAQPTSKFALEHQVELYKVCNDSPPKPVELCRGLILKFFSECEVQIPDEVFLIGKNLSGFDVPLLVRDGYLKPPVTRPEDNTLEGDYHYRLKEMSGFIFGAQCLLGVEDHYELLKTAYDMYPEIYMSEGGEHFALHDCYHQARELNGLIRML